MSSKSRTRLFIDNILVYGLGGVISKIVPLIMLPILTRLYPNSEYLGLNDLSNNFISIVTAIAVCGMYDAMFRLFFDNKSLEYQKRVCSTSLIFVMFTTVVFALILLLLQGTIAKYYFLSEKYKDLTSITILGFLVTATNQIISAPTRIQNKRTVFLITNTLSPLISYTVAIPMILNGHYIIAMPIATVISGVTLEISFFFLNKKFFSFGSFDKKLLKDLLKIGIPLVPNFLVYWIYNSSDKVMIAHILSTADTGVYSVASRIGHISNLMYTAFTGGWLFFAYSTMNDDDQVQLKSKIFEYLTAISFCATILLASCSKLMFHLLFPEQYLEGYIVAPYLFFAPLMLMLYQVIANQFTIVKKTYMNLFALSAGAIVNVVFNLFMIPKIGIEGASLATIIGYLISLTLCYALLLRMKLIRYNKKLTASIILFAVYTVSWRLLFHDKIILSGIVGILFACAFIALYFNSITALIKNKLLKKSK